jgi:hypothetical protein
MDPTQPPIDWIPGVLSAVGKWSGHESDHSPPIFVQNGQFSTSNPKHQMMALSIEIFSAPVI